MDLDLAILAHIDVEISWNKCSHYMVWSDLKTRVYVSGVICPMIFMLREGTTTNWHEYVKWYNLNT